MTACHVTFLDGKLTSMFLSLVQNIQRLTLARITVSIDATPTTAVIVSDVVQVPDQVQCF